jgi:hypothetical protein
MIDLREFQSLEEPLEELSESSADVPQSKKVEYVSTNLLHARNINLSDIKVETIEYSKIEEKFKKSFLKYKSL